MGQVDGPGLVEKQLLLHVTPLGGRVQARKAPTAVGVLNRMLELGRTISVRVA
jgi:hypothetical protein